MKNFHQVAKLFIVGVRDFKADEDLRAFLAEYPVAGLALFNSPHDSAEFLWKNSAAALEALYELIHRAAEFKIFLSVDQEGGRVARLKEPFIKMPAAGTMGQYFTQNPSHDLFYEFYRLVASQLADAHIRVNFAPVCDLSYADTPQAVGGDRSFGKDPASVISLVKLFCEAFENENVATVLKHYPGHGPTKFDSHLKVGLLLKSKFEMMKEDSRVFEQCADLASGIMSAHLAFPEAPEDILSLNADFIDESRKKLPTHLRWFTDDLAGMKAVSDRQPWLAAYKAGYDFLLLCGSLDQSAHAIEETIRLAEASTRSFGDEQALELRLRHSAEAYPAPNRLPEFKNWTTRIVESSEKAMEVLARIKQ